MMADRQPNHSGRYHRDVRLHVLERCVGDQSGKRGVSRALSAMRSAASCPKRWFAPGIPLPSRPIGSRPADALRVYNRRMVVVHHLNNSRSQRVLWLLEELGVPYEVKRYERDAKTMLAPPSLLAIHPLGKVAGHCRWRCHGRRVRRDHRIPGGKIRRRTPDASRRARRSVCAIPTGCTMRKARR